MLGYYITFSFIMLSLSHRLPPLAPTLPLLGWSLHIYRVGENEASVSIHLDKMTRFLTLATKESAGGPNFVSEEPTLLAVRTFACLAPTQHLK